MRITFEKPIQWKWVAVIFMCSTIIFVFLYSGLKLYNWRDARYEKAQEQLALTMEKAQADSVKAFQAADNLAKSLLTLGQMQGMPPQIQNQVNNTLKYNGFDRYQIKIPEPAKKGK